MSRVDYHHGEVVKFYKLGYVNSLHMQPYHTIQS